MSYSRPHLLKYVSAAILVAMCALPASAQVLRGVATNGTTKKPSAGDEVFLLRLDKGMEEEARTKTNSRGEFSFQLPDNTTMRAVRVRHGGVNYHQPVPPGTASVAVTVYESAPTVQGIHQNNQSVVFQAQGDTLQVFEIFNLQNDSLPPTTQPTFSFYLPEGATVESGQAFREGGMPLKVAPFTQGENKYTIAYPVFPGQTHLEVNYKLPYTGSFKFQPRLAGPVTAFYAMMPKSIRFAPESASQYQAADPQTIAPDLKGMDVHVADNTSDERQLAFSISGEGVIPQDSGQQSAAGGQAEDNRPGGGLGVPNERPNPLSGGTWAFLGVLTLFMAGGAGFLFLTAGPAAAGAQPTGQSASLLDALKEEMFQLEADRIQGKIPHKEYEAAKGALDKTLQRAMRRKQ